MIQPRPEEGFRDLAHFVNERVISEYISCCQHCIDPVIKVEARQLACVS